MSACEQAPDEQFSHCPAWLTLTEEVNETFKGQIKVFDTCIPSTVKVGEAVYYNMAVEQYSPKSTAGIAYRNFAKELIGYEG